MQFTPTTPLACALCLIILYLGPGRGIVALFAALPFGSAAAVNLAGLGSVFVAEMAMLTLCLSLLLKGNIARDLIRVMQPQGAAFPLLLLLLTTGVGAIFLPRVNAGMTEVYTLVRHLDGATLDLQALQETGTNMGQFLRFLIAGMGFFAMTLAVLRYADASTLRQTVIAASVVHVVLSVIDLIGPIGGTLILEPFRNAYVAVLDQQVLLGLRRLIAGFPEPSAFGLFTIGLYGFWLRLWFGAPRAIFPAVMAGIMFLLLIRSTSTAAYFGLGLYTALFLMWQLRRLARPGSAVVIYGVLILCTPLMLMGLVVMYQMVPALSDFMSTIVIDKLNSASGNERMTWNMQALRNFAETYGMGAGIGSLRASGWGFAVLGSLGLMGTILYLWFLATVFRLRLHHDEDTAIISALQSACAAVLVLSLSILPQPNLGLTFFLFAGMASGLHLRHWQEPKWISLTFPRQSVREHREGGAHA